MEKLNQNPSQEDFIQNLIEHTTLSQEEIEALQWYFKRLIKFPFTGVYRYEFQTLLMEIDEKNLGDRQERLMIKNPSKIILNIGGNPTLQINITELLKRKNATDRRLATRAKNREATREAIQNTIY